MLHQAETLIAKSCYHGDGIRQWATAVEKRYKDFARRMQKYRTKLENKLGYTSSENEVRHRIFSFKLWECANKYFVHLDRHATLPDCHATLRLRFFVTRRSFFPKE